MFQAHKTRPDQKKYIKITLVFMTLTCLLSALSAGYSFFHGKSKFAALPPAGKKKELPQRNPSSPFLPLLTAKINFQPATAPSQQESILMMLRELAHVQGSINFNASAWVEKHFTSGNKSQKILEALRAFLRALNPQELASQKTAYIRLRMTAIKVLAEVLEYADEADLRLLAKEGLQELITLQLSSSVAVALQRIRLADKYDALEFLGRLDPQAALACLASLHQQEKVLLKPALLSGLIQYGYQRGEAWTLIDDILEEGDGSRDL